MSTKRVTVYNTIGNTEKTISFDGSVLSDMLSAFSQNNINYNGMNITVGETQVTLKSAQAQLPELQEFTIFLFQEKVDSGSWEDTDDVEQDYIDSYNLLSLEIRLRLAVEAIEESISSINEPQPQAKSLAQKAAELRKNMGL